MHCSSRRKPTKRAVQREMDQVQTHLVEISRKLDTLILQRVAQQ